MTDKKISAFTPVNALNASDLFPFVRQGTPNVNDVITGGALASASKALTARQLPKWRAALAKQAAGNGYRPRIVCAGDSTTFGAWSNDLGGTDNKVRSYPTWLAKLLTAGGRPAQADSFIGGGNSTAANTLASDARVTASGNWGLSATAYTPGGQLVYCTGNTGTLAFTPASAVDTFKVWYVTNTSNGTLVSAVDTGTATNTSTAGTAGIATLTIPAGALGTHTLNLSKSGTGNIYVVAIEAYDSTQYKISVMNAGWPSSKTSDWVDTSAAWSPGNALHLFNQDLTILNLGINDWLNGVSLATYTANLQAVITQAQLAGDVALATPVPSATASVALATQQAYIDAIYTLAAANNLCVIPGFARFGTQESMNALGLYGNALHPNGVGYQDYAAAVMATIGSP